VNYGNSLHCVTNETKSISPRNLAGKQNATFTASSTETYIHRLKTDMGMDRCSIKSTTGSTITLSYNWSGWEWWINHLEQWGVDTHELVFHNDGNRISEETGGSVATALAEYLHELDSSERHWVQNHVHQWLNCGGFKQW
jgi:hypothetical protein